MNTMSLVKRIATWINSHETRMPVSHSKIPKKRKKKKKEGRSSRGLPRANHPPPSRPKSYLVTSTMPHQNIWKKPRNLSCTIDLPDLCCSWVQFGGHRHRGTLYHPISPWSEGCESSRCDTTSSHILSHFIFMCTGQSDESDIKYHPLHLPERCRKGNLFQPVLAIISLTWRG